MLNFAAPVDFEIAELLAQRKSIRAFDIQKPVSFSNILKLVEAARWTANCFNDEPWRFIVWDRNTDLTSYQKAFDCLGEWNQNWVITAPVLVATFAYEKFRKDGKPNRWAQHDTGAATASLCLEATALGMQAHPMGGFDAVKLKDKFSIPEDYTAMSMIAVGYPADDYDVLDESYREGEQKTRFRRPLGTNMFLNSWENPIVE